MSNLTPEQIKARITQSGTPKQQADQQAKELAKVTGNVQSTLVTMDAQQMQFWFGKLAKSGMTSQVINIKAILKEKIQDLMFGKPILIEHQPAEEDNIEEGQQPEAQPQEQQEGGEQPQPNQPQESSIDIKHHKEVQKWIKQLKLQEMLYANEGDLLERNRTIFLIDKLPNGKVVIRQADPNMPNIVTRIGHIPVKAIVFVPFVFDIVKYWIRVTITADSIEQALMTGNSATDLKDVDLKVVNDKLPEEYKIQGKGENPYGFINVVEFTWKPVTQWSWDKTTKSPFEKISGIQTMFDEGTANLRQELHLNKTKILADVDMLNMQDKNDLAKLAEQGIIGVLQDTGGSGDDNKVIEIIQGDPKVDQYWTNLKEILSLANQAMKLSELGNEGSESATGEVFNKGNDVETANSLQVFRQEQIAELLTKAWAIKEGIVLDDADLDTSEWSVQLIPNVIVNEAKMTEITKMQLEMGVIGMGEAKAQLKGISKADAIISMQKDDGLYNPLQATMHSFNEGMDGDGKEPNAQEANEPK